MLVFAYGSNMDERQMKRRCPSAKLVGPLTLPQGKLVFRGVADIVYSKNSSIAGVVWRISEDDVRTLDQYEGVASGVYRKRYIKLSIKGGPSEPCLYYQMVDNDGVGPPIMSYYETILAGYRTHGLDETKLNEAVDASWNKKNLTADIRRRRRKTTSPIKRRTKRLAPIVLPGPIGSPIQIKRRAKRK